MDCIVTGASKGIGKAIAERFAAEGYDLYCCSRNAEALSALQEELGVRYPAITVRTRAVDLAQKEGARGFGEWVLSAGAEIDVLVNNAGQFIPGSIHNEPDGALEEMIAANLYSAYHLTRALLPAMMTRRKGHIFNMS